MYKSKKVSLQTNSVWQCFDKDTKVKRIGTGI